MLLAPNPPIRARASAPCTFLPGFFDSAVWARAAAPPDPSLLISKHILGARPHPASGVAKLNGGGGPALVEPLVARCSPSGMLSPLDRVS